MEISEQELRAMVRAAIARHAAHGGTPSSLPGAFGPHASQGLLTLVEGGDAEGRCLIEPAVRCNHCNYCQSLGH
jgi:hypothetical protein